MIPTQTNFKEASNLAMKYSGYRQIVVGVVFPFSGKQGKSRYRTNNDSACDHCILIVGTILFVGIDFETRKSRW